MKRLMWTLAVAAMLAAPLPAAAQHAVPRGGGDSGGSSSGGSSGGGGGSSSGGSSSGGGGGSTWSSGGSGGGSTWAPPRHPTSSSSGRSGGGSGGSGTASARGGRGDAGSSRGGDPDRVAPAGDGRTRDGRPIVGYAVPRGTVVPSGRPGGDFFYYPRGTDWYYSPWYYSRFSPYYYAGYGASIWGLGYIWDPFWWGPGYGDPFYGPGYGGFGYGGGYAGGGGGAVYGDDEPLEEGGLRIKVKPREARVMVDGKFAGTVDDFDGNFQKLRLEAGAHKIELQAEGYDALAFDVRIVEGQTVTYKGNLHKK